MFRRDFDDEMTLPYLWLFVCGTCRHCDARAVPVARHRVCKGPNGSVCESVHTEQALADPDGLESRLLLVRFEYTHSSPAVLQDRGSARCCSSPDGMVRKSRVHRKLTMSGFAGTLIKLRRTITNTFHCSCSMVGSEAAESRLLGRRNDMVADWLAPLWLAVAHSMAYRLFAHK